MFWEIADCTIPQFLALLKSEEAIHTCRHGEMGHYAVLFVTHSFDAWVIQIRLDGKLHSMHRARPPSETLPTLSFMFDALSVTGQKTLEKTSYVNPAATHPLRVTSSIASPVWRSLKGVAAKTISRIVQSLVARRLLD